MAIIALAGLDVSLLVRNRSLNREIISGEFSQQPPVGDIMPPLRGINLSGRFETVAYSSGQTATFVFVFAGRCEFCGQSWPLWLRMVNAADPRRFRCVFVSLDDETVPVSVAARLGADHTVITRPDPRDIAAFNFRLTPEVMEVSPTGRLIAAWLGVLDATSTAALSRALGIAHFSPGTAANGALLLGPPRAPPHPGPLP
ncbi:MAG: hypothetical protein ACRD0Y_02810 [Terriglobales bacterium]